MSLNKIRVTLLFTSMLLIVIVLAITGAINMATFKQNFNESLAANYKVLAKQTVRKIEYAVKYGKPLNNFYGIEHLLSENLLNVKGVEEVQVILPGGDIIYNQHGPVVDERLATNVREEVQFYHAGAEKDVVYFLDDEFYRVYSPIYDDNGSWIASLGLIFTESVATSELSEYMFKLIFYLISFLLVALLLLFLFLYKTPLVSDQKKLFKKRISLVILIILGGAQITYGALNYVSLKNGYLDLVIENTSLALKVIQSDIEDVVQKGVPYSELHGVGAYMNEMIGFLPEVSRISMINADFTTESVGEQLFVSKYSYSAPLIPDSLGRENYLHVVDLSETYINDKMQAILFDTITITVLSFLLIVEMTLFVLLYLEKRMNEEVEKFDQTKEALYIRPLSFLVFCAVFLSVSYLPIIMNEFPEKTFHLPNEVLLSLPIVSEAILVFLVFSLAANFNERIGRRTIFIIGILLVSVGTLASALSWNEVTFILSRMCAGAGFGFVLLATYRYFYRTTGERDVSETFKQFQIGSLSGMYFGIVIGAMLAERIGVFNVYYIALPILLVTIVFSFKFMPNHIVKRVIRRRIHYRTSKVRKQFFTNKQVVSLFLLSVIPLATASMFLFYFFPIYASSEGVSLANIGRAFFIQGMLLIYFRPFFMKYVSRWARSPMALIVSAFFITASFLLFSFQFHVATALVVIVALGVATCFIDTRQLDYFKEQSSHLYIEEGKLFSYYHSFHLLGNVIGIALFVSCFLLFSRSVSIAMIGIVVLLFTIVFVSLTRKNSAEMEVTYDEAK